jgi:GNAT superfamily N-acetyltransferase
VAVRRDAELIRYAETTAGIEPRHLQGFFVGWPNPPSPETHLRLLGKSDHVVVAWDEGSGDVVGFVTALTDGVLCAYVPLLEVWQSHQGRGIGSELMRLLLAKLGDLYMVDLMCDPELEPFYVQQGMRPAFGMAIRNYSRQAGSDR